MHSFFSTLARTGLQLLEPLGLVWLGLLALTVALVRRRLRRLALVPGLLALLVYVIGSTALPDALLGSLERPFAGTDLRSLPQADAVVVLGGGLQASPREVGSLHLTRAADRIVTGLELMRLGKAPVLVAGGGAGEFHGSVQPEADLFKAAVLERGLVAGEIVSLGHCANTHDEAVRVRALAEARGWKRLVLVSSAAHLPRAAAAFRAAGLEVTPAPCNFLSRQSVGGPGPNPLAPELGGFEKASIWFHETAGLWLYRLRGWAGPG